MGKHFQIRLKGDASKHYEIAFDNNGQLLCHLLNGMEILIDGDIKTTPGYLEDYARVKALLDTAPAELSKAFRDVCEDMDTILAAAKKAVQTHCCKNSMLVLSDVVDKLEKKDY